MQDPERVHPIKSANRHRLALGIESPYAIHARVSSYFEVMARGKKMSV